MNSRYNNAPQLKKFRQSLRIDATYSEKVLWQDLRGRKLCGVKFYRQFAIGNFIYDFYCPEAKLAIELDGESHFSSFTIENDTRKTNFLMMNNICLLRFTDTELLGNYDVSLIKIAEAVMKRI